MSKAIIAALFFLAVAVVITLGSGCYTVNMYEQVIITQFQRPVGDPVTEPGLHWKAPFIQKANYGSSDQSVLRFMNGEDF
jgi:membrane protease subunit HflC